MDVGLLLFLNFLTVPFLYEAEALGVKMKKFPRLRDLIQLKMARSGRWLWGYCVFLLVFLLLILTPSSSGKSFPASLLMILFVLAIQACLWVLVGHRIFKSKS